ncbi:MAG: ferrochelatase [Anaerolineae bacterium]
MTKAPDPLTGILMVNLGTPDAPTPRALRRYLRQFLGDPRVVSLPRWLWLPLLHGVVLTVRPHQSARLYQKVWTDEGSPLLVIAARQQAALAHSLTRRVRRSFMLVVGMRYGNPSIAAGLRRLRDAGAARILILPLFPQHSATTTGAIFDAAAAELRTWPRIPDLRFVSSYHDFPPYIRALAGQVRERWAVQGQPDRLLLSFHGIPQSYAQAGDPYQEQCLTTARRLAQELGLEDDRWVAAFQSRVGPGEWLRPYTDSTLETLPGQGIKRVDALCPGFAADCLETLEEIASEGREIFLRAGGESFSYIPALNDSPGHIEALTELVITHAGDWLMQVE